MPLASGTNSIIAGHGNTLENNKEMFVSGTELLGSALGETGFYVLKRDVNGALHVVYRYATLADFAANVINLKAVAVKS